MERYTRTEREIERERALGGYSNKSLSIEICICINIKYVENCLEKAIYRLHRIKTANVL